MIRRVWISTRTTADGDSFTDAWPSEEEAWNPVTDYVVNRWAGGAMEGPVPEDSHEMVHAYFDAHLEETYSIRSRSVAFEDLIDPAVVESLSAKLVEEGIINLTNLECLAITTALCGYHARKEVEDTMNLSPVEAGNVMDSAYNKLKD